MLLLFRHTKVSLKTAADCEWSQSWSLFSKQWAKRERDHKFIAHFGNNLCQVCNYRFPIVTVASWKFISTLPIIIFHISKTKTYVTVCHTTGNTGQVKFDLGRGVICSHDLLPEHSFSVQCIYVLPGICILKKPCCPPTINKHALKRETSKQGSLFSSLSLSILLFIFNSYSTALLPQRL